MTDYEIKRETTNNYFNTISEPIFFAVVKNICSRYCGGSL